MTMSDEQITEIAELLDCGEICFYHLPTSTIEHHPDPDNPYFEPELWKEIIDKIEANRNNFKRIERMDSRLAFQVMENFANSLTENSFKNSLIRLLLERKPFSNFKIMVDNSDHRQAWFDFKRQAYINWVSEQLN
jgi:hypothetical protein